MTGLFAACAGGPRTATGTPAEIPALKAQAAQQPTNAQIRFRLAAALMAAGRCDTAVVVANAGQMLAPGEVLGPMVIGGCQEKDGRYDLAFATYTDFATALSAGAQRRRRSGARSAGAAHAGSANGQARPGARIDADDARSRALHNRRAAGDDRGRFESPAALAGPRGADDDRPGAGAQRPLARARADRRAARRAEARPDSACRSIECGARRPAAARGAHGAGRRHDHAERSGADVGDGGARRRQGALGRAGQRKLQAAARSREAAHLRSRDRARHRADGRRAAADPAAGAEEPRGVPRLQPGARRARPRRLSRRRGGVQRRGSRRSVLPAARRAAAGG
jgi:hypothetical protein